MSFFQNPFNEEYQGYWVLGDRAHSLTFKCPANTGRGDEIVRSYENAPYNMDGTDGDGNATDTLTISFAIDGNFRNYVDLSVDVAAGAADSTAVTQAEIVGNLNNNSTFSSYFEASIPYGKNHIEITTKRDANRFKFYVQNTGAETLLRFNKFAGVSELPTYFARHTIDNRYTFEDGVSHLVLLDPSGSNIDADIIDNAVNPKGDLLGLDSTTVREDWELLEGRSGLFTFTVAVDSTTTLTYPAGADAGDLAKMTINDGTNVWEMPHTLDSTDLVSPP